MATVNRSLRAVLMHDIDICGCRYYKGDIYDIATISADGSTPMVELMLSSGVMSVPPCSIIILAPDNRASKKSKNRPYNKKR